MMYTHSAAGLAAGACVVTRAGCRHTYSVEGQGQQQWLWSTAQTHQLWGHLLSTCTPMAAGHYHWHTQCRPVTAAGSGVCKCSDGWVSCRWAQQCIPVSRERAGSGPTSSQRGGGPGCQSALLWLQDLITGKHMAWRPVMGVRWVACRCTAGGSSSQCAQSSGRELQWSRMVSCTCATKEVRAGWSVDPGLQWGLEGREEGGERYSSCWHLQRWDL